MKVYKKNIEAKSGGSLLDKAINSLPFELHVPGYQYCGPGTKLEKRLKRGDKGINPLDSACKKHDIAYSKYKKGVERRAADRELGKEAWKRVKSADTTIGERATALAVSGIMKAKSALGFGLKKTKSKKKKSKRSKTVKTVFKNAIKSASDKIEETSPNSLGDASKIALKAAAAIVRKHKIPKAKLQKDIPRVIPVPKIGGILPLVPLFAGISALGSLIGGASGIVKAVKAAKDANNNLAELSRHNKALEAIAIGKSKTGAGLYLKPYKTGLGLYIQPYDGLGFKKGKIKKTLAFQKTDQRTT